MPAVLTAPPEIELPSIAFFGRSLSEYAQFFALDLIALRGRAVLDVAAGPSSFAAEACRRGVDAVAIDPCYGATPAELAAQVQLDCARVFAQLRAKPRLVRVNSRSRALPVRPASVRPTAAARPTPHFSSIDEAEVDRRAAAQRFLADYETRLFHGRYVEGALPRLPFLDGAFDLVLCAHLLFTYGDVFDFDWHLAACRELARVSAGETRLHPLCGLDGRPYRELGRLRRELLGHGIASEVVPVAYEFFAGANTMLVLSPAERPG